ncbi:MAG TPA: hypothetical protein PKH64_11145 [Petrotogaceae bacterium]|jgi:hypothetical protein|nr:hypothetical protein [Petrotogaceae bacterium]HQC41370.1 hypothetical protein [Petrotogaceae bacterium]
MDFSLKRVVILGIFILMICTSVFCVEFDQAYSYYLSGMKAYRIGDYKLSQDLLYKSIQVSPQLENYDANIKLYLGLSAFQNKDYAIALEYLPMFSENPLAAQALESIKNNGISSEFHFKQATVPSTQEELDASEEKSSFPLLTFFLITFIIFVISAASAFPIFIYFRKHGLSFSEKPKAEIQEIPALEEVASVPIEEVVNLKLDNIENIWKKSNALRMLIGDIENEYESSSAPEIPEIPELVSTEHENLKTSDQTADIDNLQSIINDSLKTADLDSIEKLLNSMENQNISESSQEITTEIPINDSIPNSPSYEAYASANDKEENQTSVNSDLTEQDEKQSYPESENIQPVNPNKDVDILDAGSSLKTRFKDIMKGQEKMIFVEAQNTNDISEIIERIESENSKNGSKIYSKIQLEKVLTNLFYQVNESELSK